MAEVFYPAIVETGEGGFGVFFPDLPGCVSAGATIDETARNAVEALALHIQGMAEDGVPFPSPTPIDSVPADPEVREAARILVPTDLPGRSVRVNVTFDEALLSRIDRAAEAKGMSRSALLAEGARRLLVEG